MNYIQCPKCHLCLPITETIPVIAVNKEGQKTKVRICVRCKDLLDKERIAPCRT